MCIERARLKFDGYPVDIGPSDEERKQAKLRQVPAARSGRTKATGGMDPNHPDFWTSIGGAEEDGKRGKWP